VKFSEIGNNWHNYRPTKAVWFWSCVGVCVLTIGVGFTWGGWVTGGTAKEMAENQAQEVATTLGARICVDRFVNEPEAHTQLTALKEESRFRRRNFVSDGGWSTIEGAEDFTRAISERCAQVLADMELPAPAEEAHEATTGDAIEG